MSEHATIPYTLDRRPDTGVSNTTMGLWLFLASEVMLFGALFSVYALLRVSATGWPLGRDIVSVPSGAFNTALLSAMTMVMWRARSRDAAGAVRFVGAASALALVFLVSKGLEYRAEIAHGLVPSLSTYLAIYFTLTGFHALHVIGGLMANAWAIAGRAGQAMTINRIRLLSLYWAFVDAVWIVIFLLVYLS